MGKPQTRGFTIIETMLFLAISGALVVAMVAGTGASINIQRYRDSVETFKAYLQNQYGALSSVQNDRGNEWGCGASAETSDESSGEQRGQSECVLLGRYVTIESDVTTAYSVLGRSLDPVTASDSDIDTLRNDYVLNVSSVEKEESTLEWGVRIAWPKAGDEAQTPTSPRSLALLLIRSPTSGQIYTFTSDTIPSEPTPASLRAMIVSGDSVPGQRERTICLDSDGLFVSANASIYISPYATGPSSVETRSNDYIASLGGDTEC